MADEDKSIKNDAYWAHCCKTWSEELRLVWSENGVSYLDSGGDGRPPSDPLDDHGGSVATPEVGKPLTGTVSPDGDVLDRWHKIDGILRDYFSNELLSGKLDSAEDFLQSLADVAIGSKAESGNLTAERPDVEVDGEYVYNRLEHMRDSLDWWKGEARDNFKAYLLDMQSALVQYQTCVSTAWVVASKYRNLVLGMRRDVKQLVASAQKAFAEEDEANKRQELTTFASLVTSGVSMVTFAATAAGGAAKAAAGMAVADSLKNAHANHKVLEVGYNGKGHAVAKAAEGLQKIVENVLDQTERVKDGFYAVTGSLTGDALTGKNGSEVALRPKRPNIVTDDKFDPEDFHHDDQPRESRDGASKEELVEDPKKEKDHERDHWIKDPSDGRPDDDDNDKPGIWDKIELPKNERKPDAYEEQ